MTTAVKEGARRRRGRPRARGGHEPTKDLLREAAMRILERDGVLEGIRLQDVADEAEVSRGLINHYFASRRALLRDALAARRRGYAEEARRERQRPTFRQAKWAFRAAVRNPQWGFLMALLALDGDEAFEPIDSLAEVMASHGAEIANGTLLPSFDPEAGHSMYLALACGWSLLRVPLARQLGLPVSELDSRVEAIWLRMVGVFLAGDRAPR